MRRIFNILRFLAYYYKFRQNNKHNNVRPSHFIPSSNVTIGRNSYGKLNVLWMAPLSAKLRIGNYCSIGPDVKFLIGGQHDYKRISTWPFQTLTYHQPTSAKEQKLDITVEDDVWIGMETLIMSGVNIGKGTVIAARSIVTKDIPAYSVFVGNKVVKKRFPDSIIEKIKDIDFSKLEHTQADSYANYCKTRLTEENVDEVLSSFLQTKGVQQTSK